MRFGLSILMLAGLILQAQERSSGQRISRFSADKEAKLGEVLAGDIRRQATAIESNTISDYVERLGSRLGSQFIHAGLAFSFTVVTDHLGGPTHEPLALPGGYIFIPADLILAVRDEAELGAMLAHAMAHVADRHIAVDPKTGENGIPLTWLNSGDTRQILLPRGFMKSQREFELRADRLTVAMVTHANLDPAALVRYIQRLQPAADDKSEENSSLPSLPARITGLEQAIAELPPATYTANDQFSTVQEEVRRLMPAAIRRSPSLRRNNLH